MNIRFATVLIACCVLCACATGQKRPKTGTPDCPAAQEVAQAHMLGWWEAQFWNPAESASLLLGKNAHYADSFSGAVYRNNGERSGAAGDVDDGDFTLEESADGVRITATWTGEVVEGSCGREIRGTWQSARDRTERAFVLRRQAGP
jgi:hypothetical protein